MPKDASSRSLPSTITIRDLRAVFRFRGSQDAAEAIVGKWRAKLLEKNPTAKREKLAYQTASDRDDRRRCLHIGDGLRRALVFASSDVTELKALLDRADRRSKESARYAGWGRVISRSGGAHAVELRGVFLSATKDFCRQTRIAPRGHRTAGHA